MCVESKVPCFEGKAGAFFFRAKVGPPDLSPTSVIRTDKYAHWLLRKVWLYIYQLDREVDNAPRRYDIDDDLEKHGNAIGTFQIFPRLRESHCNPNTSEHQKRWSGGGFALKIDSDGSGS